MRDEVTCADCGRSAPKTETEFTLIGAAHGWRLRRTKDARGRFALVWRCPGCWAQLKKATGATTPPPSPSAPPPASGRRPSKKMRAAAVRHFGKAREGGGT